MYWPLKHRLVLTMAYFCKRRGAHDLGKTNTCCSNSAQSILLLPSKRKPDNPLLAKHGVKFNTTSKDLALTLPHRLHQDVCHQVRQVPVDALQAHELKLILSRTGRQLLDMELPLAHGIPLGQVLVVPVHGLQHLGANMLWSIVHDLQPYELLCHGQSDCNIDRADGLTTCMAPMQSSAVSCVLHIIISEGQQHF